MDDIEKAIAKATKYRYKLYDNSFISKQQRLQLFTDIAEIVNHRKKTRLTGYEVSVTWMKLRRKFARAQLKILRKKKITENDKIIHQHLIYLKPYISTKNIDQFDQNSDTVECCKECYEYDVSSEEDQLDIAFKQHTDNGSLSENYVLKSKIKTEPQDQNNEEYDDPQNEISVKEEPGQNYVDVPTITISDSDEEVIADHDTVQDVKPKIEKTAETSSRKGKQIINRKPIIKGTKAKAMNQYKKFDCNFPKTKTEKKNVSSSVEVALQSFQSSVLNMKRKKTISQYAAVMNNHLQMLPEGERVNCLMEVLEIIESYK